MIRIQVDDLKYRIKPAYWAYIRKWLEENRALIVMPDDVRIPDSAMPGNFTSRPGRWGEDEPYPPYERNRQLMEDARAKPPEI